MHGAEPGCAVRAAVSDGSLAEERFASYQKLGREIRPLTKQRLKIIGRSIKQIYKLKNR
jgi:ribosome biogenesis GTPase